MTSAYTAAPDDMIAKLWDIARMWLADAIDAFGPPAAIAQLVRAARRGFARRLKALETLTLKLLLVEAARLPAPAHPRTPVARIQRAAAAAPTPNADSSNPQTWPVRFQLRIPPEAAAPRVTPNSGPRIRDLGPARTVNDIMAERASFAAHARMAALRAARAAACDEAHERARAEKLARRFEALRRTLIDPLPRARRLKRKLLALKSRAYDAAMRIAMRQPPPTPLNRNVFDRADFESCCIVPAAIKPPDSS